MRRKPASSNANLTVEYPRAKLRVLLSDKLRALKRAHDEKMRVYTKECVVYRKKAREVLERMAKELAAGTAPNDTYALSQLLQTRLGSSPEEPDDDGAARLEIVLGQVEAMKDDWVKVSTDELLRW